MANLAKTCRSAHELVQSFLPRAFNINAALRRFFKEPLKFRSLQRESGMLISGSFALQFLDRTVYDDSDLDLYCNFQDREKMGLWLMNDEGYTFAPNSLQDPDFRQASADAPHVIDLGPYVNLRGISTVFTFTKKVRENSEDVRKVQLIVVHRSPMEAILNYHSSWWPIPVTFSHTHRSCLAATVMNVIAYDYAYSLYPRATFEERLFLLCVRKAHRHVAAIDKYRERGFIILHEKTARDPMVWKICDNTIFPTQIPRWMGDEYTWRLPLSLDGLESRPAVDDEGDRALTTDPCFVTSWTHELALKDIALSRTAPISVESRIKYDVVAMNAYKYRYVCAPYSRSRLVTVMALLMHLYNLAPIDSGDTDTQS